MVSNNLNKNIMEKNINKQMSLEEYKKRVEERFLQRYPGTTKEDFEVEVETLSKKSWEEYKEDFSPEMLIQTWATGA
ncbi:MAG: hypothetical protein ACI3ZZ_01540 [Candidatus Aphodosoma sp.]